MLHFSKFIARKRPGSSLGGCPGFFVSGSSVVQWKLKDRETKKEVYREIGEELGVPWETVATWDKRQGSNEPQQPLENAASSVKSFKELEASFPCASRFCGGF